MQGCLAFIGGDRQVWTVQPDGAGHRQLTYDLNVGSQSPWGGLQATEHRSWPCWSPDGRWLSCFQTSDSPDSDGAAWLTAIEVDGVEEKRLVSLEEGYPLYSQWSPDSSRIAVLMQQADQLAVAVATVEKIGSFRLIEEGVPIFFSWTDDSKKLLIHSGSQGETRLVLRAVEGSDPDQYFPKSPGSFSTPAVMGERAVFVAEDQGHSTLCVSDLEGGAVQEIERLSGQVAHVVSPCHRFIAFTTLRAGKPLSNSGLWVADVERGEVQQLMTTDVVAYFWLPRSEGLLVVTRGRGPTEFHWNHLNLENANVRRLVSFYPSQDQQFFLRFFEQFATSHSPVSADGKMLAYAGHPDPRKSNADTSSKIHVLALADEQPKPEVLAPGEFAVFAPY
jgi:Tol biopolymer transport system component